MDRAPMPLPRLRNILVIGGARSGKSRLAQQIAEASGLAPLLVATAIAGDDEMTHRIARHRADRGEAWTTIEEPRNLAGLLPQVCEQGRIVVVDCLTFWLANHLFDGADLTASTHALAGCLTHLRGPALLVTNETGFGIVPDTEMGRRFRDAQGLLNQTMAAQCHQVLLAVAGQVLQIKPAPAPDVDFGLAGDAPA